MNSIFSNKVLSKESLVNKTFKRSKVAQVIQWVAESDGVAQFWLLSNGGISIPAGGRIEFKFIASVGGYGSNDTFFDNVDRTRIRILNGSYDLKGGISRTIDGDPISTGDEVTTDGLEHVISVVMNNVTVIEALGARFPTPAGTPINTPLFDLVFYDENDNIINEIPLTNKEQGATQLPTVGTISATMANYTKDVWKKR